MMTPEQAAVIEAAKEWVDFNKTDGKFAHYGGTRLKATVNALIAAEAGHDFSWAWEQARAGNKVHHNSWKEEGAPAGTYLARFKDETGNVLGRVPTLETIYSGTGWKPGPVPAKQ